jgi:hypothetical protein
MNDLTADQRASVWMVVWRHPQHGWFAWEWINARQRRSDLYAPLRAVREKYPDDKFKLAKFVMVQR